MKTLLLILCILILAACLLMLVRLRVSLEYGESGPLLTLFLGRIPFLKLPGEKKRPVSGKGSGRKQKRQKKKETDKNKKKTRAGAYRDFGPCFG